MSQQIKVGDRFRYIADGREGKVTRIYEKTGTIEFHFDDGSYKHWHGDFFPQYFTPLNESSIPSEIAQACTNNNLIDPFFDTHSGWWAFPSVDGYMPVRVPRNRRFLPETRWVQIQPGNSLAIPEESRENRTIYIARLREIIVCKKSSPAAPPSLQNP